MSKNILIKFVQGKNNWETYTSAGKKIMELANEQGEIFGYCGGQLACTTCRVYIQNKYTKLLPKASEAELDTLCELPNSSKYPEKDYTKRMSCQLICDHRFNGLTIHIPETIL
jgi:2Fe-2S ferredoxin